MSTPTTSARPFIRPYRPSTSDRAACSRICCLTGNAGKDATGLVSSDELWGEIWVLPYLDRHPEYAWVVEMPSETSRREKGGENGTGAADSEQGEVVGYIVGAPDTAQFERYFSTDHWPAQKDRFELAQQGGTSHDQTGISGDPAASSSKGTEASGNSDGSTQSRNGREEEMLAYAASRGNSPLPDYAKTHPAHLHINLLSAAQRQGLGRRMIDTLLSALKRDGVRGVHLGAAADNHAACIFYKRVGFGEVPGKEGERVFVMDLDRERDVGSAAAAEATGGSL